MTENRYICDRCRCVILADRTHLAVECGPVRQAGHLTVDLCGDCGPQLLNFLRSREPALAGR